MEEFPIYQILAVLRIHVQKNAVFHARLKYFATN